MGLEQYVCGMNTIRNLFPGRLGEDGGLSSRAYHVDIYQLSPQPDHAVRPAASSIVILLVMLLLCTSWLSALPMHGFNESRRCCTSVALDIYVAKLAYPA